MKTLKIDEAQRNAAAAALDEVEVALFGKSFQTRTGVKAGNDRCNITDPGCARPLYGVWV